MLKTPRNFRTLLAFAAASAVLPAPSHALPPDVYSVTYYDAANDLVGTGTFRIDRYLHRCVETSDPDDCTSINRGRKIGSPLYITAGLQHFNVNINGRIWREQDPDGSWWSGAGQAAGQRRGQRGRLQEATPAWVFGDSVGIRALRMEIERAGTSVGTGTWIQSIVVAADQPPEQLTGTWVAVPLLNQ